MAAGDQKQAFIESFRLMPVGIQDFLTQEIPEPPNISTPADTEAANIAAGVLSKYMLDFIRPFAGFTPIEMMARIGQHNSVHEIAMLAGLAYLEGADSSEQGFEILEPQASAYLPGELRLRAQGVNGTLINCAAEIGDHAPVSMEDTGEGVFEGYLNLEDLGEYTANFSGTGEDDTTLTGSVTFTIAEETTGETPAPPTGTDDSASAHSQGLLMAAVRKLLDAAEKMDFGSYPKALLGVIKAYYGAWLAILKKLLKGQALEALEEFSTEANSLIAYVENALNEKDKSAFANGIGKFMAILLKMQALRN